MDSAVLGNKFQVGDLVIGNLLANEYYAFTRQHWVGRVIVSSSNYIIVQSAKDESGPKYTVEIERFDLFKRENKLVDKMRRL